MRLKQIKQKFLSLLLAAGMIAGTLPISAYADEDVQNNGITNITVYNAIAATQTGQDATVIPEVSDTSGWANKAAWTNLKTVLEKEMVPQAVTAIMKAFPYTFGYLEGSSIGIGLNVYHNSDNTTLAAVAVSTYFSRDTSPADVDLFYTLNINAGHLYVDEQGNLTESSRIWLEGTLAHEMMHAMMYEALTCGMLGQDKDMNYITAFPLWFVEGTAQTACGGVDRLFSSLKLDQNSSDEDIKNVLTGNLCLGSDINVSPYSTGYLATMYLGYLASGEETVTASNVASGLDRLLNEVRGGTSLSDAVKKYTSGKYENITAFQETFGSDTDVPAFFRKLLSAADTGAGAGALITGNLSDRDILANEEIVQPLFKLDTEHQLVKNEYPDGYTVMSGGAANTPGLRGPDYIAYGDSLEPSNPGSGGVVEPSNPESGGESGGGSADGEGSSGGGAVEPSNPGSGTSGGDSGAGGSAGGGASGGATSGAAGGGGGAVPLPAIPIVPETPEVPATGPVTNVPGTITSAPITNADMSQNVTIKDGEITATVDKTTAGKIVENAVANKSEEIIIDATVKNEAAAHSTKESTVELPAEVLSQITEKTKAVVTVKTDVAAIKMDTQALAAVADAAEGNTVSVVAEKVKADAKEIRIELAVVSDGKKISDFKGGKVSVTVPAPKGKKDLVCVYIDAQGHYHKIPGQLNADSTYTFITDHFSTYAILEVNHAETAIAEQKAAIEIIKFKLSSKQVKTSKGKKGIKLTWSDSNVVFDGIEIQRSFKKTSGYGKKPYFTAKKGAKSYTNTAVKTGARYYYRARGFVTIDGEKVYTKWSSKAYRTVK